MAGREMWRLACLATTAALLVGAAALTPLPWGVAGTALAALGGAAELGRRRRLRAAVARSAHLEAALLPDAAARPAANEARFAAACRALRERHGVAAPLATLPLYVGIGAPHSGLRTLLEQAGVDWLGPPVPWVGGGSWSLSPQLVVLRPLQPAATRGTFEALLRQRPRRPIDGVLIALSLEDLAGQGEGALRQQAQALRAQLDGMQQALHSRAPVYLVITKCDRLRGFNESFSHLRGGARERVMGMRFGELQAAAQPVAQLGMQLDEVLAGLSRRVLSAMQASAAEQRDRIFAFPDQLASLRTPLLAWAHTFFASSHRRAAPQLRGLFFCSAVGGSYCIDRLAPFAQVSDSVPVPEATFTRNILPRAILGDRQAATSVDGLARVDWSRRGTLAASCVLVALPLFAYLQGSRQLARSREALIGGAVVAAGDGPTDGAAAAARLAGLDRLRQLAGDLGAEARGDDGTTWLNRASGMSQGAVLQPRLRRAYLTAVRDLLVAPLVARDAQQLHNFAQRHQGSAAAPGLPEYRDAMARLKAQLLLTGAWEPARHRPDAADGRWLRDHVRRRLARAWAATSVPPAAAQRLGALLEGPPEARLEAHLDALLDALPRGEVPWLPRDGGAVGAAQQVLARLPVAAALVDEAAQGCGAPALDLQALTGGAEGPLRGAAAVRGAFTRQGYGAPLLQRLAGVVHANDLWVLGAAAPPPPADEALAAAVEAAYWDQVVAEWEHFVGGLSLAPTAAAGSAAPAIEALEARLHRELIADASHMRPEQAAQARGLLQLRPWLARATARPPRPGGGGDPAAERGVQQAEESPR